MLIKDKLSLLKPEHFPVSDFFNAIPVNDFNNVINQLAVGVGSGFNDVVCTFPSDIEPGETAFKVLNFGFIVGML